MFHKCLSLLAATALAVATMAAVAGAGEVAGEKHVWVPPVDVTQALKITMETKATKALLKKADERCFDAECHQQVQECRKVLARCVIVPSPASVHEQEIENN